MFYRLGFRVQGAPLQVLGVRVWGMGSLNRNVFVHIYIYMCVCIHILSSYVDIWGRHIDRERGYARDIRA